MRCTEFITLALISLNAIRVDAAKLCSPKTSRSSSSKLLAATDSTWTISTTRDGSFTRTTQILGTNTGSDTLTTLDGASSTTLDSTFVTTPVDTSTLGTTLSTTPRNTHSTTPRNTPSTTPGDDPSTPSQTPSTTPATDETSTTTTTTSGSPTPTVMEPEWARECKLTGYCTPDGCAANLLGTYRDVDLDLCYALCNAIVDCRSFRFLSGSCDVFNVPEAELRFGSSPDPYAWYDASCATGQGATGPAFSDAKVSAALSASGAASVRDDALAVLEQIKADAVTAQAAADAAQRAVARALELQPDSAEAQDAQGPANDAARLAARVQEIVKEAEEIVQRVEDQAEATRQAALETYRATTAEAAQAALSEATRARGATSSVRNELNSKAGEATGRTVGAQQTGQAAENQVAGILNGQ